MAKRIKNAGLKLLLNFHGDNWADPGKQYTPAAWKEYYGSGLEGQVYRYTNEVINRFMEEEFVPIWYRQGTRSTTGCSGRREK